MPVNPRSLKNAWAAIRARIPEALPGTVLEQALPVRGDIGLSAVVRVNDAMPGIVIRVSSRWPVSSWQVLWLTGVRFEHAFVDQNDNLLPVMMADEDAVDVFGIFASDLASALSVAGTTMEARMSLLMGKIALWKRFFKKNTAPLSEEEVRGLIGEIEILSRMITAYGVDAALETWKGPDGELHDFRYDAFRIEVKTWFNESAPRIFISDPSQIVIDAAWPVFIAAVQLAKDDVAGLTLPERIATVLKGMTAPQKSIIEVLLADVGYLSVHAELYSKRYTVADSVFYHIRDDFPLIDPTTLPGGVTNLKYALELGALSPFISSSPIKN
jgi:hypothetical protein